MQKIFLVGWREFQEKVKSRGFIIGSLTVPVMMIVIWAFSGVFGVSGDENPMDDLVPAGDAQMMIGYVDHADLIRKVPEPVPMELFRAYEDEAAAQAALERGEIVAFYVVSESYRQSGDVQRVSQHLPTMPADSDWFSWVLVGNLFPDADIAELRRLRWPFDSMDPQFVNLETERESNGNGLDILPFIVTIAIMLPLFTSGGYLLQSVTQEKSSRIMEVLLVSLRPWHMLAGKLLGLGALTLVQYLIWGVVAFVGVLVSGQDVAALLGQVSLSAAELSFIIPFALGGFLLYAGLMAGVGALAPDLEGSRNWVFMISLPMMIPIYVWTTIVNAPNSAFSVALSMIPFSAPVAMLMRIVTVSVPEWQLITSLILLLLTGIGVIWLMARLFQVQTLLSGELLSIKRFWRVMRQ